jgi:hypothetical protein
LAIGLFAVTKFVGVSPGFAVPFNWASLQA